VLGQSSEPNNATRRSQHTKGNERWIGFQLVDDAFRSMMHGARQFPLKGFSAGWPANVARRDLR
jgi:hypothetical protein